MATQAAPVRVSRGAWGVEDESAAELVVSAGPSSNAGGGEFVAMIATILGLVMSVNDRVFDVPLLVTLDPWSGIPEGAGWRTRAAAARGG